MRNRTPVNISPWLLPVLLVAALLLGLKQITDVDALLHLVLGKLFVTTKSFPQVEPFCYPAAETPFLYTSWLFATVNYLIFDLFGGVALSLAIALCVGLLAYILYRDAHLLSGERHHILPALAVCIGLLLAEDRFTLRPELLLYLFFAIQVWLLGRWVFNNERRGLWLLPLVTLLWGNSHSSVILLVVPFGAFAVFLGVELLFPEGDTAREQVAQKLKWLWLLGVISLLAALCNPNGIGQFLYGQNVMASDWYQRTITELMPPRAKELWIIWPLFAVSGFVSLLALRRRAIPYLLISVAALYVGLSAVRFFAFFCLVQAPIIGRGLAILAGRWHGSLQHPLVVAGVSLLIVLLSILKAGSFYPLQRDRISQERFGAGYAVPVDHADAVAYLQKNGIKGRVFNVFEDGQAILWQGWPELTVFIDGRGAIPVDMLESYTTAFTDPVMMQALQSRFDFEVIVMRRFESFQVNPHGTKGGFINPDWVLTYFDQESYVFLRQEGPYQALIERDAYRNILANGDFKSYLELIDQRPAYAKGVLEDLSRPPANMLSAFDHIILAYCHFRLGDAAKAVEAVAPYKDVSSFSLYLYGRALQAQGRKADAAAVFRDGVARYGQPEFRQALQAVQGNPAGR